MLKQIGKYTISERIGRGTYSRVYRAVDHQGRAVAIKVSTTQTEPQHLDAFQKDLVSAASVLHPNLVAVHDLGFEDDFPYLVMELVEGQDLDKLLKSNAPLSLSERIRVMEQVGGALKAAHERGVCHLDVRPSKIMLADSGQAKLLDLGLGLLSFDPARVTENGYLVGAPFYMSPERLTAIDTANESCDIWSFGVTFYEWLSGHHPFFDQDGDGMIGNIMDAAPADLLNVPPALNHLVLRAIEKDPADRYRHFTELLADLQPLIGDLKREESDALMAEALKQTDSGRWHEARRIARQMRDLDPQQNPGSQIFGISDPEVERERFAERARPAAVSPEPMIAAAAAAASAATAVETPIPAPPPPVQDFPSASPVTPPRSPQRPERTAPKIPPMGLRNGAAAPASENGAPINGRASQAAPPQPSKSARVAAAATPVLPAAVRETETALNRESESFSSEPVRPEPPRVAPPTPRTRPASNPRSTFTQSPAAPQPTVRILEIEESRGFPWARIAGFAIPALLVLAALFFFVKPISKTLKASSSEEAKEISSSGRVIKPDNEDADNRAALNPASTTGQDAAASTGTQTDGTSTDPLKADSPRSFDAKSLPAAKPPVPTRRANKGPLAGIAAPALPDDNAPAETAALPVSISAPPPPAPIAPPPAKSSSPVATPAAQSVEAARESSSHVGGLFSQPQLVHKVSPIYPPAAVQRKAQGTVRFQATIAKDGSVKNIQLLSGDPLLNVAARQAVLQWKYRPASLNGVPTEVTQTIVVNFSLSNQ